MFSRQNTTCIRPEALAAARWWGDQLRGPTQRNISGDSTTVGAELTKAAPAADAELNSHDVTEDRIVQFEAKLAETISAQLNMPREYDVQVSVGYDPNKTVYKAAQDAGIPSAMIFFSSKTVMVIRDGEVKVSAGYCAKFVNVPMS